MEKIYKNTHGLRSSCMHVIHQTRTNFPIPIPKSSSCLPHLLPQSFWFPIFFSPPLPPPNYSPSSAFSYLNLLWLLIFVLQLGMMSPPCHLLTPTKNCVHEHFFALLQLKHGFFFQDGQSKTNLSSWNVDNTDCCSWEGITCDAFTGHVISLNLSSLYSLGVIDSRSIFQLQSLQRLDLCQNHFDSSPPSGLAQLSNLTHLSLSHSNVYGQIPFDISCFTRLVHFVLSHDYYCFLFVFCKPAPENQPSADDGRKKKKRKLRE